MDDVKEVQLSCKLEAQWARWTQSWRTHGEFLMRNYLRYDASELLIPDTGNKEKHCANMMIGLIDACKLSVFGLKALTEAATGSDTENLFRKFNWRFVGPALDHRSFVI